MLARELAWVVAGFTALTLVFMGPLLGTITSELPGPVGDPRLNAWILAWAADRLPHALHGFWSPPVFYPYSNTLAYSENLLGIAIFVAPVYWVSKNPILTYNVAFLLAYVTSAAGAYLLARELTGRRDAALVAAAAFAFAPYRWPQIPHLQVLSAGWLPIALWALHRTFVAPTWQVFAVFAASFVIMAFSNGYAAYQTAFAIGLVVCWSAAKYGITRAQLLRIAAAAAAIGLVLAPAIVAHMEVWGDRNPIRGDFMRYSVDLSSYLSVAEELPQASFLPGREQGEGRYFPGVLVVLLAIAAVLPAPWLNRRRPPNEWRWLYVALAVLGALLSLGPRPQAWGWNLPFLPFYGWLLDYMPLFQALRVPARFGMLVVLAFSILSAMGAARIVTTTNVRVRAAAAAVFLLVIVREGWGGALPTYTNQFAIARGDEAAYEWVARQPRGPLLDLPLSSMGDGGFSMKIQYAMLNHRQPTISGVSRIEPPLDALLGGPESPLFNPSLVRQAVPFLRALGVRYVLVRPSFFTDKQAVSRFMNALATSDGSRLVQTFDDVHAYELTPLPAPQTDETLTQVPASALTLDAFRNADRLKLAIDDDPASRWLSGVPQSGREWIEIAFDRPRDIGRLELVTTRRSLHDFPRHLEIVATDFSANPGQHVLYNRPTLEALGFAFLRDPELPVIAVDLPSHPSAKITIRQLGRAFPWYWSIDELRLWERTASR